jgi:hypothetical protein
MIRTLSKCLSPSIKSSLVSDELLELIAYEKNNKNSYVVTVSVAQHWLTYLHDGQEDLERNPIVSPMLVNQLLNLRLGRVLTQSPHHIPCNKEVMKVRTPVRQGQ